MRKGTCQITAEQGSNMSNETTTTLTKVPQSDPIIRTFILKRNLEVKTSKRLLIIVHYIVKRNVQKHTTVMAGQSKKKNF